MTARLVAGQRRPFGQAWLHGERAWFAFVLAVSLLAGLPAQAQRAEMVSRTELRVCADPNNLPYSNEARQGFENRIAEIIGADLELPVTYVWFPQVTGFVRNTLRARECDLVMGAVSGDGIMDSTNPYYHTGYMMVTRTADGIAARSVGDPALAGKKFGVIAATPPTDLLVRHHLMDQVRPYALRVDTRISNPPRAMLQDLVDGQIDVALVWGPTAGYAIKQDHLPLTAVFIEPEPDAPRLDYRVAMGVRANEPEWRRRINQAIGKHKAEIAAVLADYGMPMMDEQGQSAQGKPTP